MADSISIQESCVCVYAHHAVPLTEKPIHDHFFIDVRLSMDAVSDFPPDPLSRFSQKIYWESNKLLQYPRQAFLSGTDAKHREIITNMIQSLEIPFPLDNIHWSVVQFFPTKSRPETLDEITSRLACVARDQARKDDSKGHMRIIIRKVEKLSPDDYREFCSQRRRRKRQGPLHEWILENQKEETLQQSWCIGVIEKLIMGSPSGNKCFGLKSVKVKEEREDEDGCSICCSSLEKGRQAIRMPCSHIFHGFCIFRWIARRPTCPLCRFEIARPDGWRISRDCRARRRR